MDGLLQSTNPTSTFVAGKERIIDSFPTKRLAVATPDELATIAEALREVLTIQWDLGQRQDSILSLLLAGQDSFREWDHVPEPDVYAPHARCQYYYHAHAGSARDGDEHGHFHTFFDMQGAKGFPLSDAQRQLAHIIGISLDTSGQVSRLFTLNSWAADDIFLPADQLCRLLPRFSMREDERYPVVSAWLSAFIVAFAPVIEELIHLRDERRRAREQAGAINIGEDTSIEVLSSCSVNLIEYVSLIESLSPP